MTTAAVEARVGQGPLLRRLLRDSSVMVGGVIILLFVLAALFAPVLAALEGQDPYTYHLNTSARTPRRAARVAESAAITGSGSSR